MILLNHVSKGCRLIANLPLFRIIYFRQPSPITFSLNPLYTFPIFYKRCSILFFSFHNHKVSRVYHLGILSIYPYNIFFFNLSILFDRTVVHIAYFTMLNIFKII